MAIRQGESLFLKKGIASFVFPSGTLTSTCRFDVTSIKKKKKKKENLDMTKAFVPFLEPGVVFCIFFSQKVPVANV